MTLTLEQKATNFDTMRHIERVRNLLHIAIKELLDRAEKHDQSKLVSPEVEAFTEKTKELAGLTYGTPEYFQSKKEIDQAIQHHYANNPHHPEHYKNGINDMNLLDVLEMFCDWKAASERHNDGNLRKSIEVNANRFNMSPQLVQIFENTVDLVD
jgi:predicted metal-dependent phosphoesterase TrpH